MIALQPFGTISAFESESDFVLFLGRCALFSYVFPQQKKEAGSIKN